MPHAHLKKRNTPQGFPPIHISITPLTATLPPPYLFHPYRSPPGHLVKTAHMVGAFDNSEAAESPKCLLFLSCNMMRSSPCTSSALPAKHTYISVLRGVAGWRQTRQVWLGLVPQNHTALPKQSGLGSIVLVSFSHTCSNTDLYSSCLNTWLLHFLWTHTFLLCVDILWQQILSRDSEH